MDSSFLFESQRFLKLGLVNFVCFKFLLGGGYGSWAGVTRYFSAFYAANSLLRLAGKAIVNMDWPMARLLGNKEILLFQLERTTAFHDYGLKNFRGNQHKFTFDELAKAFPDVMAPEHGALLRDSRVDDNYDLLVPAQTGDPLSIKMAEDAYTHDFADQHYGEGWNLDAVEYLANEYISYGYEEDAAAEWLKSCLSALTEVGRMSVARYQFVAYFKELDASLSRLSTKDTLSRLVTSWVDDSLGRLDA